MVEIKGNAFILRAIQAQDADLVLRLLTRSGEKLSVFAKAALKSKKRFGGALQPFLNISFRAVQKNSHNDLIILEEAQVRHEFGQLTKSLDRLWAASRITELIDKSAHSGLDNPQLYDLFGAALRALDSGLSHEGVERQFEIKLLSLLGWLPQMAHCGECGKSDRELSLHPVTGHVLCSDCGYYPLVLTQDVQGLIKRFLQTSILSGQSNEIHCRDLGPISSALLRSHF